MGQRTGTGEIGREFSWFTAVGGVGFAVDAALFLVLNGVFAWPVALARTVSASCSIATTWALNRRFTFAARQSSAWRGELARYTAVQTAGLVVNLGVFALCLWLVPPLREIPIVALACGAAAALLFNFLSARTLAFRGPGPG
jgi:putative flippase GtrA